MINLFDWFDQKAQDLYYSLEISGFNHPTVVIHDDGFLPSLILSPIQFFCQVDKTQVERPLYFNQVPVPKYYRISGTNTKGEIHNLEQLVANIFYANPSNRRFVKAVDWLDKDGSVRLTDHYNQYGWRFAQTNLNMNKQAVLRTYFDQLGHEVLVENFVTGDITLNWKGELKFFKNQSEFLAYYFREAELDYSSIWYNSLSTPFLTSHSIGGKGKDILFWQEDMGDTIPGNMQLILTGGSPRTHKIIVQDKQAYQKLLNLLPDSQKDMVKQLGYIYPSRKQNDHRKKALVLTNSDQIESLDILVKNLPEMHVCIGALTEMSTRLESFGQFNNITLYPNVSAQMIEQLFNECDIYLDINHESEIVSAVRRAFESNQAIFAFTNTVHDAQFVAQENIFKPEETERFISVLKELPNHFDQIIALQREGSTSPTNYKNVLNA